MWYLKSAFDAYSKVQSSLQTRLSEMQSAALSPIQMVKSFLQTPAPAKGSDELRELRRRLAELEAQQKKTPSQPMAKKKRVTKKRSSSR